MTKAAFLINMIVLVITITMSSCSEDFETSEGFVSASATNARPGSGSNGGTNNQINNVNNSDNGDSSTTTDNTDCTKGINLNSNRTECNTTLNYVPSVNVSVSGNTRTITANNIPDHKIAIAGPNSPTPQNSTYSVSTNPQIASRSTELLGSNGPTYSFGVLLNGVEVDPIAAEPWPHDRSSLANANWGWNLEAMHVLIGLDCNNAHTQPTGKYHYHGNPTLLVESMGVNADNMSLLGYAADGFPIYHKYGYASASGSGIKELVSSYRLKTGTRPGDGNTAPCGSYDGVYSNDFEYVEGIGDLDECNGRIGVTPDYPNGTYYYVISADFPYIPRCFVGTPSTDFRLGGGN